MWYRAVTLQRPWGVRGMQVLMWINFGPDLNPRQIHWPLSKWLEIIELKGSSGSAGLSWRLYKRCILYVEIEIMYICIVLYFITIFRVDTIFLEFVFLFSAIC